MKTLFLALAILVAGGAAFFSYNESVKLKDAIATRITAEQDNTTTQGKLSKAQKEIDDLNAKIAAATTRKEEISQSVAALRSSGTSLKRDITKLEAELKAQDDQMAEMKKALEELSATVTSIGEGVTLDNLQAKIQEMTDAKTAAQTKLDETNTLAEAASKSIAESRAEQDRMAKRKLERASAIRRNASESVITAVNADWGFVVLGAGANSGFTPSVPLLVERDGRFIGKVVPSSVEPTQTIAEIDASSLAEGVRFQPGDRVILGKTAN